MTTTYTSKHKRRRVSLYEFMEKFDTEDKAMRYFEQHLWKGERHCPRCGIHETREASHKTMPYWCKVCRKYFSVKTGTLMEGSNLPYRKWFMAIYLLGTSIKGISSTKLANDLGIGQQAAWYLGHRIRQAWAKNTSVMSGLVEVDEVYLGGKESNKHAHKKLHVGGGSGGKTPVLGLKERGSGQVTALKVSDTTASSFETAVLDNVERGSSVFTDDHRGYLRLSRLGYKHQSVTHTVGEYVRGQAHTNGIESFWSLLKRGYYGIYHKMSPKHLQRYINEFSARHNVRRIHTIKQIDRTIVGLFGDRLKYKDLICPLYRQKK